MIVWLVGGVAGTGAGIVAGLLVMVTPAVVQVHESVLSEPLFIALLVLTLAAMARAPARPLVSGTLAGLASIVRYAGISLVGGVVLWQLARAGSVRERIVRAATAATARSRAAGRCGCCAPYTARGRARSGRSVSTARSRPRCAKDGARQSAWLVPGMGERVGNLRRGRCGGADRRRDLGLAPAARATGAGDGRACCSRHAISGSCSRRGSFADPGIPLDDRLMAPLLVLLEVAMVLIVAPAWRHGRVPRGRWWPCSWRSGGAPRCA